MESITRKTYKSQLATGTSRIESVGIDHEIGAIAVKEETGETGDIEETGGEGTEVSEEAGEEVVVIGETAMGVEIETVTLSPRRRKSMWTRQQGRLPLTSRSASRK